VVRHDVCFVDLDVVQIRGAARRQALAHGIEIVDQLQPRAVAGQHEAHFAARFIHRDGADPVRVQRPRAVVLAAVGAVMVALAHQAGADGAVGTAHFPARVAEQLAIQVMRQPALAGRLVIAGEQAFEKQEAGPQRLCHVRVHRGDIDDELDHVAHRGPAAALGLRNAPGQQLFGTDAANRFMRQDAVALALFGALAQFGQQQGGAALEFGHAQADSRIRRSGRFFNSDVSHRGTSLLDGANGAFGRRIRGGKRVT